MPSQPTEQDIRLALIESVTAHCKAAGIAPRTLCERALNDPNFFIKLTGGANFTLRTYERMRRYLESNPPKKTNGGA